MNKELEANILKYNQGHLLEHYKLLNDTEKKSFEQQLGSIDYALMADLYKNADIVHEEVSYEFEPIPSVLLDTAHKAGYFEAGVEVIKAGKVASVLMAGGQGTRLGYDGPKGSYDIGLEGGETLFELHCNQLKQVFSDTGVYIKWYVMTSESNHDETCDFFEKNQYFDYPKESIRFFKQGQLPVVTPSGDIIIKERGIIALSPDGNGGCYMALKVSGILDEMAKNGVEWINLFGVDNALAKVCDPVFVGFAAKKNAQISSKVVTKKEAKERVGVVGYKNGNPTIIEYSELSEAEAISTNEQGELRYNSANIVNHLIKVSLVKQKVDDQMDYHVARKYTEGINAEASEDRKPNSMKFETFIFDLFMYSDDMSVLEVVREEEFAPVKNKEGADSPASAKALVEAYRKK